LHKDFTCVIFLAKCDKAFATFEIDYPKRGARWKATFLSRKKSKYLDGTVLSCGNGNRFRCIF